MNVQLQLGDCLEVMRSMPENSVDAVITDPPYGIGIANNPFRQKFEKQEWDNKPIDREVLSELKRISKYQVIWGGNYFELEPSKSFLVWDKCQPYNFTSSMCEQAWTNLNKPAKLFRHDVKSYQKQHPTQKPVELMVFCINLPKTNHATLCGWQPAWLAQTGATHRDWIDQTYFCGAERRIRRNYNWITAGRGMT